MNVQLVVFDLGGVLVKVEPLRMIRLIAQETQRPVEQLQQMVIDPTLLEPFELGRIGPKQFFDEFKKRLGLTWSFEQFVKAWNSILSEKTDTTWLLERLRTRYALAVLSNINVLHDEYIRQTWPVFNQIHHWIASYQVGCRKPESQIYELVLRQADAPPQAVVYVDDIEGHIVAARRLGLTAIHFTDGLGLERELRAVGLHV